MIDALAATAALLPKVRETEVAMTTTISDVARRKAELAEQAGREKAAAAAAFDSSLERAAVGELFAIADELKSKGDTQRAREALRKLLSRFPDHRLAPVAAGMLTEMQGK